MGQRVGATGVALLHPWMSHEPDNLAISAEDLKRIHTTPRHTPPSSPPSTAARTDQRRDRQADSNARTSDEKHAQVFK